MVLVMSSFESVSDMCVIGSYMLFGTGLGHFGCFLLLAVSCVFFGYVSSFGVLRCGLCRKSLWCSMWTCSLIVSSGFI